ncbi:MAG TPA: hypothetical protein VMU61_08615, partial [Candidatus Aquilonibacter sp.]|nr:hypothetical protein [Candidatus Aquilonibacter sp.]
TTNLDSVSRDLANLRLRWTHLVAKHDPRFVAGIVPMTAPLPVFRFEHPAVLHRIAMQDATSDH